MFSDSIRQQASSSGVYNRGFVLCRTGAVSFTSVEESDSDLVTISGTVDGNYQSFYRVRLTIDVLFDSVVSSYCTCPAFEGSEGLCKHCVAMALAYHDNPEAAQQMAALSQLKESMATSTLLEDADEQDATWNISSTQTPSGSRATTVKRGQRMSTASKPREAETSLVISDVISAYAKRAERDAKRMAALQAAMEEGADTVPVTLIPTLSHDSDTYSYSSRTSAERNWSLKLRIQRGKASYVVKHVDELVNAWEQCAHFEYGKNLAFTHVHSAFDDTSNRLMNLISQVTRAQRAMYLSRDQYWFAGRGTHIKELPLSPKTQ